MQAALTGDITADNWSTVATDDTWGPHPTTYGSVAAPASCADASAWKRELLIAVENYWVEQGINYCHHHIPGWTPPDDGAYRNSSAGSTSGEGGGAMTCTSDRFADGHQRVSGPGNHHVCSAPGGSKFCDSAEELASSDPTKRVQWLGVDCSDFTSWAYNFAGITAAPLPTAIGTQACSVDAAPGALIDINASNIETPQPDGKTLEDKLQPGDLLYVLSTSSPKLAHVVTWTGLHWRDLKSSSAAASFDAAKLGAVGSRLGGDLTSYGASLAELESKNPYMIIDSHYAGPAYRPFVGWYRGSVSHVRRIVDAELVANDAVLAPYALHVDAAASPVERAGVSYQVLVAPKYASSGAGEGHRLLVADTIHACERDGHVTP